MTDDSHRQRGGHVDDRSPRKRPTALRLPKVAQGSRVRRLSPQDVAREARQRYGQVSPSTSRSSANRVRRPTRRSIRQVFTASTDDLINVQPNLSRVFGPGSVFALDRAEHRNRRKLLAPPFHGQSIKNYEKIIEEETLRESANWPEGKEFRTLEPMNRITLNVILRTVFGADGVELDYLRRDHPAVGEAGFADGDPARSRRSRPARRARGRDSTSSAATSTASCSR